MDEKGTALERVQGLVNRFAVNRPVYLKSGSNYNETQLRTDFLNDFLKALGWDVDNRGRQPQRLREVLVEEAITVEDEITKKKPDYTLRHEGERVFFVEAKKPRVAIERETDAAFQTRRYGWNAGLGISVLTNFDKLAIYDCTQRPTASDGPQVGRIKIYAYTEYVEYFDDIYDQLSRASVLSGRFAELFGSAEIHSGTERFDDYFLRQIERWRQALAINLAISNPSLKADELNFLIQRLINRIVFLRICEDRNQEAYEALRRVTTYDDLKAVFREADRRYNSGLFNFIEDTLSFNVRVDSDLLVGIFNELYFPQSSYDFSVVEPQVLGQIYEQFLAKQVELTEDGVILVDKPEIAASSGVVTTPKYMVDRIVSETLSPLCADKGPEELGCLKVADIACGSGVFLLAAYQYLLDSHLEWYISHLPESYPSAIYEAAPDVWRLTLAEKQRILTNCIYGVDIDIQAVEIARFSLMIKVLDGETAARIDALMETNRLRALPNLNGNIQCGNSLVDNTYYEFDEDAAVSGVQLVEINPFDWHDGFPEVMRGKGFDAIIGNPPYIRIQNMVRYSPHEVAFFGSPHSPFTTALQDNFDKYALFVERAISLLKPEGRLGYIVPHRFLTIRAGQALRTLLGKDNLIQRLVHFGTNQVFPPRKTYTCLLILERRGAEMLTVEHVIDLAAWRHGTMGVTETVSAASLPENGPWMFVSPALRALFDRVREDKRNVPLGGREGVADIFVGVQTSADKIYVIRPTSQQNGLAQFTDKSGTKREIESAILRPCLMDIPLVAFSTPQANTAMIFPYRIVDGRAVLYTPDEMQQQFPYCWDYLSSFKNALSTRSIQNGTAEMWYRFGRSQSLTQFGGAPKVVWPVLSLEPRYAYDVDDILFTGGGNGPYYALRPNTDTALSPLYLMALLSHSLLELMVRATGSVFYGGYVSHGKQVLAPLPIRHIDFEIQEERKAHDSVVQRVQRLIQLTQQIGATSVPNIRQQMQRQFDVVRRQLERSVADLYDLTEDDRTLIELAYAGETEEQDANV